jgi:hypothetical protein
MEVARYSTAPSKLSEPPMTRSPRDGEGFASDQGFVDGGNAREDEAVDRNALAGAKDDDVAGDYLAE